MYSIRIENYLSPNAVMPLGIQGEDEVRYIYYDLSPIITQFGEGQGQYIYKPAENGAYALLSVSRVGNILKGVITKTETQFPGNGELQLVFYPTSTTGTIADNYRLHIIKTMILPSLDGSGEAPDGYESWIQVLQTLKNQAQAAATAAATSASNAATSATNAATSAANAAASEENAATSEENAAESEENAADSEDAAATSELNAAASESNASQSAIAAANAKQSIENMSATAVELAPGATPTVTKTIISGHVNLEFGIPEGVPGTTEWSGIQNKPTTFPPSAHTHTKSNITDFPTALSEFDNDENFIDNTVDDLVNYYDKTDTEEKIAEHADLTDNPHEVTKTQVGLGNVDNTSDANKPVSTLTQAEIDRLDGRCDALQSMGRYLALWNCVTGLPTTNPTTLPYTYRAGDYYRISNANRYVHTVVLAKTDTLTCTAVVYSEDAAPFIDATVYAEWLRSKGYTSSNVLEATGTIMGCTAVGYYSYYIDSSQGWRFFMKYIDDGRTVGSIFRPSELTIADTVTQVNLYRPNGATYTGAASTTIETETDIAVGDVYLYDGTTWSLQINHSKNVYTKAESDALFATKATTYTKSEVDTAVGAKSTVSVSASGTATDVIEYITVDGVEKKLKGAGEWGEIQGSIENQTDLYSALTNRYTKTETDTLLTAMTAAEVDTIWEAN